MNHDILAIDVKKLTKTFGERVAVNQIDLSVKQGEIYGFLGPNGSGKTTTMRMLCGLMIPDSGSGQCLGMNVLTESYAIKQEVGYMAQRFSLYEDLTILENIRFIASLYQIPNSKEKVRELIEDLGLTSRRHQLAGSLSGGWKQRLALGVCLLHSPRLLLLDEPTAGVDPKARRIFWDKIHELSTQGITTLVSTHYMDEAERCHRLAYINMGNVLVTGTLPEIIEHTKLFTYEVRGEHLGELAAEIRGLPGLSQVAAFGTTLHVSGLDIDLIEQSIAPYKAKSHWSWKKVSSSLEDAFISLSDHQVGTQK